MKCLANILTDHLDGCQHFILTPPCHTLPRGGMNWKLRPPRIKRFAEAGILHPEALGPRDAKSLQIFRFDGGVFSNSSLPKAVYSFRKRGIGNYTPHHMAGQY